MDGQRHGYYRYLIVSMVAGVGVRTQHTYLRWSLSVQVCKSDFFMG